MKQIEKLIAETNGLRNVLIQTIEELSELSKECSKRLRLEVQDKTLRDTADCILECNITEEIADVEFCIEQLKHLLGISDLKIKMIREMSGGGRGVNFRTEERNAVGPSTQPLCEEEWNLWRKGG